MVLLGDGNEDVELYGCGVLCMWMCVNCWCLANCYLNDWRISDEKYNKNLIL